MAVIADLPQVTVSVRVTGAHSDCLEYEDPDPPTLSAFPGIAEHSAAKVIESQTDAEFHICYKVENSLNWLSSKNGIGIGFFIDGKCVGSVVHIGEHLKGPSFGGTVKWVESPSHEAEKVTLRRFKFSYITRGKYYPTFWLNTHGITDTKDTVKDRDDKIAEDKEVAKHLGIIEVVICRRVRDGESRGTRGSRGKKSIIKNLQSELSKTALIDNTVTHGTSFTEGEDIDKSPRSSSKYSYPDGEVRLARFFFRYKSREVLENEGIIAHEPSPPRSSSPEAPTVEGLSQSELRRLAQERLNDIHAVKREKRVKREASGDVDLRPVKIYKTDADGVIDLTDD